MNLFLLRLKKLSIILLSPILRKVFFRYFVMAGVEHRAALSHKLLTVVDVGANRGQFALAARAISGAKVISFEPLQSIANIFQKIFQNDPLVNLHIAAIGAKSEKRKIHISARDDSSSLLEISEHQVKLFPGTHSIDSTEINVAPLAYFLSADEIIRPAMLKLDVQGFEIDALIGCASHFNFFDYIYCECSFIELYKNQKLANEVIDYLHINQFSLIGVYNPYYHDNGQCIQADFLFVRKN